MEGRQVEGSRKDSPFLNKRGATAKNHSKTESEFVKEGKSQGGRIAKDKGKRKRMEDDVMCK